MKTTKLSLVARIAILLFVIAIFICFGFLYINSNSADAAEDKGVEVSYFYNGYNFTTCYLHKGQSVENPLCSSLYEDLSLPDGYVLEWYYDAEFTLPWQKEHTFEYDTALYGKPIKKEVPPKDPPKTDPADPSSPQIPADPPTDNESGGGSEIIKGGSDAEPVLPQYKISINIPSDNYKIVGTPQKGEKIVITLNNALNYQTVSIFAGKTPIVFSQHDNYISFYMPDGDISITFTALSDNTTNKEPLLNKQEIIALIAVGSLAVCVGAFYLIKNKIKKAKQ